jgi:hypothetical protein
MSLEPKRARHRERIDASISPPCGFVAAAMNFAMVAAAQWDGEFVARSARYSAALCETEMMRVRRPSTTYEARFLDNRPDVGSITNASRLGQCKHTFVDCPRTSALI